MVDREIKSRVKEGIIDDHDEDYRVSRAIFQQYHPLKSDLSKSMTSNFFLNGNAETYPTDKGEMSLNNSHTVDVQNNDSPSSKKGFDKIAKQSPLKTSKSSNFHYTNPSTPSNSICNCFHKNRHHYHRPRARSRDINALNSLHKQSSLSNSITGSDSKTGSLTSRDEAPCVSQSVRDSVTSPNGCQQAANKNFHEITTENVGTKFQQLIPSTSTYPVSEMLKDFSGFHSNQTKLQFDSNLNSCGRHRSQDLNYCYFNKTKPPSIPIKSKTKSRLFNSKHFAKNMHRLSLEQPHDLRGKRKVFQKSKRGKLELSDDDVIQSAEGFKVRRTRNEFLLLNKSRSQELPVSKIEFLYNGSHSQSADEPLCHSSFQYCTGPNQEIDKQNVFEPI